MTHPARENRFLNSVEMRERRTVLRSMPYSVQLEVTTKCNLACIMCARDKYHGRGEDLADDILDPVLDQILPTAQDIIVSSFGEPLLYPRFRDILLRIEPDSGLQLGFFTNLLLLTEEMAEELVKRGAAYVNASIDGASKETYERIRAGGKWETLLEKIELLNAVKRRHNSSTPHLNLCVVGSTLNIDETALFVEFARAHGFDSVKYNPNLYVDDEEMDYLSLVHEQEKTVRQFRVGYQRALELDLHTNYHQKPYRVASAPGPIPRQASHWTIFINRLKRLYRTRLGWRLENNWNQSGGIPRHFVTLALRKAGNLTLNAIPVYGWKRRVEHPIPHVIPNDAPPRSCGNAWTHVHVKSDGLVYPCCFSDEVMGDLRKQSFAEIWNGEKYQDLRRSLTSGNYWASCRKASCNWVEGGKSSEYGCRIELTGAVESFDGSAGAEIPVRIANTGRFRWRPPEHKGVTHRNYVALAYRLFNARNELIDEGGHVPIPRAVKPGDSIEMTLAVKPVRFGGPVRLKIDMVHEGITWFGERGNNARDVELNVVNVPFAAYVGVTNKALVKQLLAGPLIPGERFELPLKVRNVGTETLGALPETDFVSCHWRDATGEIVEWEGLRATLNTPLEPGGECAVALTVEVPRGIEPGTCQLEIDLVREDQEWLSLAWGRPLLAWRVEVEERAADEEKRAPMQPAAEAFGQCAANTGSKGIW
ncbi:MAG: hypothetical protein PWP23_2301 [Candidatus Sumerlaeota bacterium]|nr:hypothetical protein [Candidatus Sumerlaeota bacterium]